MKFQKEIVLNSRLGKKIIFALALLLGLSPMSGSRTYATDSSQMVAQTQKKVSGKVVDATGEPLIGVSVSLIGQSGGTITDIDGNYSITVPVNARLKFSYIGYQEQEITISNQNVLNVTLEESSETLEEVVVVGYGTQDRKSVV